MEIVGSVFICSDTVWIYGGESLYRVWRLWRDCGSSFGECVDIVWEECGDGVDMFGDSADIVCGNSGEIVERVWRECGDSLAIVWKDRGESV